MLFKRFSYPKFGRIISSVAMLFLMVGTLNAQSIDSLKINEEFSDVFIEEVFLQLENKHHIPFFYKSEWLQGLKVSILLEDELFLLGIHKILESTDLTYTVIGDRSIIVAPSRLLSREYSQRYFIRKQSQQSFNSQTGWPENVEIVMLGSDKERITDEELAVEIMVKDGLEGDILIGATIQVKGIDVAETSNSEGKVNFLLPDGLHLLEVSMLGYETLLIGANLLSSDSWEIELLPEATELDEVLVNATADDRNVRSTIVGMTRLSPRDIKDMPVFLGEPDVIKGILTLPE